MKPGILLVGSFLSIKGRNRSTAEDLAVHLQSAGYSVETTSSLHPRFLRLVDILWTAFRVRKHYAFAYVEAYSGMAFIWAEMVCGLLYLLGKPYILALHGGNLPAFASNHPARVRRVLQGAKVVTAPSRYLQDAMRPYRQDILLLPNPLDIHLYPFHLRGSPQPRLIWLRAFHAIYHPQMAVEVLVCLLTVFPDAHLTMIGPDKGDGSLQATQQLIEKYRVQKQVTIVPGVPKNQVPGWLMQADVFINTTNVDNTPISVMEALACGLCIVSTNVGGLPYLLQNNEDALLVSPDASQAMADAIVRLLTEPGLAEKLSGNARYKVENFDWSVILPQWIELFK